MEADDRQADGLAHALHLVLPAFVQNELQPVRAAPLGACRCSATVVELDSLPQPPELRLGRLAFDLDVVDLLDAVARVGEAVGERAVVREHEGTGRVDVEAADGHDPGLVPHEVDNGRTAPRVARGRDHAGRLVQEHVRESLRRDRRAVQLDAVSLTHERVQLPGLAVDGDATGLDQLVGAAAGRDAGPGEVGIQAHGRHYSAQVPHYISLMRWTSQGMAGLPAWRERVEEGERIVEEAGGRLIGVYVTLGRYDVVEIFEAPDDDKAAEILMRLQRHGAEHTETLRGFTREEAEAIIRRL